jgi:hypothetical protein
MKKTKKKRPTITCDNCDKRVAKYRCSYCNYTVCKKCENELYGECPDCEPPRFIKIK